MAERTRLLDELTLLRHERRRLQELLACYREMQFEAMIPDCRERIERLSRRIRRLELAAER